VAKDAARRAGLSLEEGADGGPLHGRSPQSDPIDSIIARMMRTARKPPAGSDDALRGAAGSERRATDRQEKEQASRTAVALESMAIWIEGAEKRLNEAARASADHQDRIASFLLQALSALKERLDTVERHLASERARGPRMELPVEGAMAALAPLSETLAGLRADLSRLAERLDRPAPWTPAVEAVRAGIEGLGSAMSGLATREDIAALDRTVRDVARDLEPGRLNADLRTLAQSIAALYGQVQILSDEMAEGAHRRIGEIDLIKRQINGISGAGIDRSVIEALTGQIVEMRRDLMRQDLAHRTEPQQIAHLSETMAVLGRQIADLRANQAGRGDFSALKTSLEQVCSALGRTAAAQEAGNVPEQIRRLSQRLDDLASRPEPQPANLEPIARQLALLTDQMTGLSRRRFEEADVLRESLDRLSSQVAAVAEREPSSQEPLMQRFDRIEQELRQAGQRVDASRIEAMLRSIEEKLERAPAASGLDGLEQRITALAECFTREPPDRGAEEAATRLRHLQDEAAGIAERAARAVLKEIGPSLPDAGDLDALKQGFVEWKALQSRADAKTQQSLRAVHEALEILVARFPSGAAASQAGPDGAQAAAARFAGTLAPADRLEAAVRRLHAAALSQIEEVSSGLSDGILPGTGKAAEPEKPSSAPSRSEADLGNLRASLIAAARRAARNPSAGRADPAASPPQEPDTGPAKGTGETALPPPSLLEKIRRTLDGRPLLLGLAALILTAGTALTLSGKPAPSMASPPADPAANGLASPVPGRTAAVERTANNKS
jgi:localization factor PodJL